MGQVPKDYRLEQSKKHKVYKEGSSQQNKYTIKGFPC